MSPETDSSSKIGSRVIWTDGRMLPARNSRYKTAFSRLGLLRSSAQATADARCSGCSSCCWRPSHRLLLTWPIGTVPVVNHTARYELNSSRSHEALQRLTSSACKVAVRSCEYDVHNEPMVISLAGRSNQCSGSPTCSCGGGARHHVVRMMVSHILPTVT